MATVNWSLQHRRDTAANWASNNPVLLAGQMGIVTDQDNRIKIGDGVTAWNSLSFAALRFNGTSLIVASGEKITDSSGLAVMTFNNGSWDVNSDNGAYAEGYLWSYPNTAGIGCGASYVQVSKDGDVGIVAPSANVNGHVVETQNNKGANNGYASLDAGGKVPASQLPNSVMTLEGEWDASTNTPTLADGSGNAGMVYECTVAGTVNFGSGAIAFQVGDFVVYGADGLWYNSPNSNLVMSVNGQTGTVTLTTTNINEGSNLYHTAARVLATVLTGFSTASSAVVSATDTILQALGKLQAQITSLGNTALLKANNLSGVADKIASRRNLGQSEIFLTGGNFTTTSALATNITGLSTSLEASSRYIVRGRIKDGVGGTGGLSYGITSPSGATFSMQYRGENNAATAWIRSNPVTSDGTLGSTIKTFASAGGWTDFELDITTTNSGTLQLQVAAGISGQTVTIYEVGTMLQVIKLS